MEQEKLCSLVEIANVPVETNEQAIQIATNLANNIKQPREGIKSSQRVQGKKDQPSKILVLLRDEETRDRWLMAAKTTKTTVSDIHPTIQNNKNAVYIRESMTKYNKSLFWNAKQELKINNNFKFVWFKKGLIKARKDENEKTYIIRTMDDIRSITNNISK